MAKTKQVGDRAAKAPAASEAQVHLAMDQASFDVLTCLVDALEASSINEVIRRAIQAHELVDPDFDEPLSSMEDSPTESQSKKDIKTLHVRIPAKTKTRLDKEKLRIKGTYSDVVMRSIMILAQIVHDRSMIPNGENHVVDNNVSGDADSSSDKPSKPKEESSKCLLSLHL